MTICDNETKIYPDLNPTAPQEPQGYHIKKLTEIEAYLLDEICLFAYLLTCLFVNSWEKMESFDTVTSVADTSLITSTVITGGRSIAAFASGVGLPVGIELSGTSLLLSFATVITPKSTRIFTLKQEKHDSIKLLA